VSFIARAPAGLVIGVASAALGISLAAQGPEAPAPRQAPVAPASVTTTAHPPLPASTARYWIVPDAPLPRAAQAEGSAAAQLARGVKLIEMDSLAAGLPLVKTAALDGSPLASYARYYAGVALIGLNRPAEAEAELQAISPRPGGHLRDVVALRMAEAAMARMEPKRAAAILVEASREARTTLDEILLRLGAAYEAADDRERATQVYERVYYEFALSESGVEAEAALKRLSPPTAASTSSRAERDLVRAEQLFAARRWAPARDAFAALARAGHGEATDLIALRIAECDQYLRRNRDARAALESLQGPGPFQAEARYFYLTATRALGDHATYVTLARRLVADHPNSPWAEDTLNNLASHYVGTDDEEADRVFRELVRRFPRGRYADRAAWRIGWHAYKRERFAEAAATFEAAAAAFPRADYRPSWLYWAARAHEQQGNRAPALALYRVTAADYYNSYYGRLSTRALSARKETTVEPIVTRERFIGAPSPIVPTEQTIRALAAAALYDDALREVEYARRAWGDSPALQATVAWIRNQRALQDAAPDRFADLRGAITIMRRAYPQFMAAGGESLPEDVLRVIFPLDYWPLIKKYSDVYGFDPYLMTALVAQESTFTPDVRSSANAVGLMQLIPPTARRYAVKLGLRYSSQMLTQPETNVRLGMRYFKDLTDRFGGAHLALAGYNAGENRIVRWVAERPGFEQDEFIDDIPFPETQNYVKRILGTADDYRRLYGDKGPATPSPRG
jgi:soluble lytic murein transglycosylase